MPDPIRLQRTLAQAIRCFQETPGRRGRLVRPPRAKDLLVAGDLHGNVENFRALLLQADLSRNPDRHIVLQEVIHGPYRYPTGGDKSHQMLDLVAALKCQFPDRVHLLPGNHELAQAEDQLIAKGDEDLNEVFREGVENAYRPYHDAIYEGYRNLILAAPFAVATPNRVFLSHSLPSGARLENFSLSLLEKDEPDLEDMRPGGGLHALVWGRDTRASTIEAFLKKVDADLLISGHIPCDEGFEAPNPYQLILDSQGSPACYCLFPADRAISHEELLNCVRAL